MSSSRSGSETQEEDRLATGREAKHVVPMDKTAEEVGSLLYLKEWNADGLQKSWNQVMYDLIEESRAEAEGEGVGEVGFDSRNY